MLILAVSPHTPDRMLFDAKINFYYPCSVLNALHNTLRKRDLITLRVHMIRWCVPFVCNNN